MKLIFLLASILGLAAAGFSGNSLIAKNSNFRRLRSSGRNQFNFRNGIPNGIYANSFPVATPAYAQKHVGYSLAGAGVSAQSFVRFQNTAAYRDTPQLPFATSPGEVEPPSNVYYGPNRRFPVGLEGFDNTYPPAYPNNVFSGSSHQLEQGTINLQTAGISHHIRIPETVEATNFLHPVTNSVPAFATSHFPRAAIGVSQPYDHFPAGDLNVLSAADALVGNINSFGVMDYAHALAEHPVSYQSLVGAAESVEHTSLPYHPGRSEPRATLYGGNIAAGRQYGTHAVYHAAPASVA